MSDEASKPELELHKPPSAETWVTHARIVSTLVQADRALERELADALPDTVEES